jgi:hypothetical protein
MVIDITVKSTQGSLVGTRRDVRLIPVSGPEWKSQHEVGIVYIQPSGHYIYMYIAMAQCSYLRQKQRVSQQALHIFAA